MLSVFPQKFHEPLHGAPGEEEGVFAPFDPGELPVHGHSPGPAGEEKVQQEPRAVEGVRVKGGVDDHPVTVGVAAEAVPRRVGPQERHVEGEGFPDPALFLALLSRYGEEMGDQQAVAVEGVRFIRRHPAEGGKGAEGELRRQPGPSGGGQEDGGYVPEQVGRVLEFGGGPPGRLPSLGGDERGEQVRDIVPPFPDAVFGMAADGVLQTEVPEFVPQPLGLVDLHGRRDAEEDIHPWADLLVDKGPGAEVQGSPAGVVDRPRQGRERHDNQVDGFQGVAVEAADPEQLRPDGYVIAPFAGRPVGLAHHLHRLDPVGGPPPESVVRPDRPFPAGLELFPVHPFDGVPARVHGFIPPLLHFLHLLPLHGVHGNTP